jgi:hypothetical protein
MDQRAATILADGEIRDLSLRLALPENLGAGISPAPHRAHRGSVPRPFRHIWWSWPSSDLDAGDRRTAEIAVWPHRRTRRDGPELEFFFGGSSNAASPNRQFVLAEAFPV